MTRPPASPARLVPCKNSKATGIDWLGRVPSHWSMVKLKTQFTKFGSGATPPNDSAYENGTVPWAMVGDLNDSVIRHVKQFVTAQAVENISTLKIHDIGTLLVSMYAGAAIGKTGILAMPACCNQACLALSGIKPTANVQYVQHLVVLAKQFLMKQSYGGAQPNINSKIVKSLTIPLPPIAEQQRIAAYLSDIGQKINALTDANNKTLALLQEQRQALIAHAITGKTNLQTGKPHPRYQTTNTPYLGKIPAHWTVSCVKRHYNVTLGKMLQNTPESPEDMEMPYLKSKHVQWAGVNTNDVTTMWVKPNEAEKYGIRQGDLLVCEGGEGGRCAMLNENLTGHVIQNALHRVRPLGGAKNEFLRYVMYAVSASGWFEALNNKATIAHFTVEKFNALRIPIPPLAEQATIVAHLNKTTAAINQALAKTQKENALLQEYRTRLTADLTTGKRLLA